MQADANFNQGVNVGAFPEATAGYLTMGGALEVDVGFNVYTNPSGSSTLVDSWASASSTSISLDGAATLCVSAAAIALAALNF